MSLAAVLSAACMPALGGAGGYHDTSAQGERVILLHGLGRTSRSMAKMERHLAGLGYAVTNVDYSSRRFPIERLSDEVLAQAISQAQESSPKRIHFVAHSLGGIVVRYYLAHHELKNIGRVVMLAPPNQGSELADALRGNWVFLKVDGPAGQQLATGEAGLPAKLGPVRFECGVIAGTRSINPLLSSAFKGPNDGKVSVAGAKVEGMTDFVTVPHSHTFMMRSRDVMEQTAEFLRTGRFKHAWGP